MNAAFQETPTTIAIVEDDERFREVLTSLLNAEHGFCCSQTFGSAEDALAGLGVKSVPDVVLMDISLPGKTGIQAVAELKPRFQATEFVMLTLTHDDEQVFQAVLAGASGFLLKHEPLTTILAAIQDVRVGGSPMSSGLARRVLREFTHRFRVPPALDSLSPREEEVLRLIAQGSSYKDVAIGLGVSPHTIRNHCANIYRKLHITNRRQASALWRRISGKE